MEDENKVKYGLKNVYYARASFDDDGNVFYDTPVRIPGAVSLSLDAEGDIEPWYADNILYAVLNGNAGYTGDLEIALIPESFCTDILHEIADDNSVMAEVVEAEVEHFALLFQFEGDAHKTRHVLYNCVCSRPAIESSTVEETKEPQTDTLSLIAAALPNGYVKAKTCSSTPEAIYDTWFDQVYEPDGEAVTFTVYFYNGSTLLQTVPGVPYGGSAEYTGSTPVCSTNPDFAFLGWDPEPTNIKRDTRCYAQFEEETYTVYFYNGSILLQTVTGVPYGGSATYTGETPVSPDDPNLAFTGWEPSPTNVTGNLSCYAQFKSAVIVNFTVRFHPTEQTTGKDVESGNVTITVTNKETGAVEYSQTKLLEYSNSYVGFDYWYLYEDFDSWSDVTQKYDVDLSVEGYTVITKSTGTSKNSSGNFNVQYNVTQLLDLNPVADANGEIIDDWDTIIQKINDGTAAYTVGQYKPLDLGDEGVINMEIVGQNADSLADGSGYASYSWIGKELLKTDHRMNPWDWHSDTTGDGSNEDGTYDEGYGGIGGWEKCEMRAYLKESIWPLIPSNVRAAIKTVTKTQSAYNTSGAGFTQSSDEDIWIPTSNELNGRYNDAFADSDSRVRCVVDTDTSEWWWLRNSGGYSNYYAITGTGGTGNSTSSNAYGVCIGFCL